MVQEEASVFLRSPNESGRAYIQYNHGIAAVIRELGYPSRQMILRWHQEYAEHGNLHNIYKERVSFAEEQKRQAIPFEKRFSLNNVVVL